MVARADGSSVRELAIGEGMFEVSWSPGGQTVTAGLYSQATARLFDFDIDSGAGHAVANGVLFPEKIPKFSILHFSVRRWIIYSIRPA